MTIEISTSGWSIILTEKKNHCGFFYGGGRWSLVDL
jgi:hypothetical protein